jgi:hypothetical protein
MKERIADVRSAVFAGDWQMDIQSEEGEHDSTGSRELGFIQG